MYIVVICLDLQIHYWFICSAPFALQAGSQQYFFFFLECILYNCFWFKSHRVFLLVVLVCFSNCKSPISLCSQKITLFHTVQSWQLISPLSPTSHYCLISVVILISSLCKLSALLQIFLQIYYKYWSYILTIPKSEILDWPKLFFPADSHTQREAVFCAWWSVTVSLLIDLMMRSPLGGFSPHWVDSVSAYSRDRCLPDTIPKPTDLWFSKCGPLWTWVSPTE